MITVTATSEDACAYGHDALGRASFMWYSYRKRNLNLIVTKHQTNSSGKTLNEITVCILQTCRCPKTKEGASRAGGSPRCGRLGGAGAGAAAGGHRRGCGRRCSDCAQGPDTDAVREEEDVVTYSGFKSGSLGKWRVITRKLRVPFWIYHKASRFLEVKF